MSLQKSHSSFLVSSKDSREHGSIIMKGHAIFAYENWRNSANKSTKLCEGKRGTLSRMREKPAAKNYFPLARSDREKVGEQTGK